MGVRLHCRFVLSALAICAYASTGCAEETVQRPLVIVPGILGSKLCTPSGGIVWGTASSLWNFSRLQLDEEEGRNLRPCGLVEEVQILGPLYSVKAYGPLINSLKEMGFEVGQNLFIFDYDWRRSNIDTANLFKEFISSKKRANEIPDSFDIIAHSMGGIVTRLYLESDSTNKVNKVIYLGTPFLGSANTLGTLSEGWGAIENTMAGGKEKIREVALSFPALLEILPRYEQCCYVKKFNKTNTYIDVFSADQWVQLGWLPMPIANDSSRLERFREQLARAKTLTDTLKTPATRVLEVKFAGDPHPTRTFLGMLPGATRPSATNWIFSKEIGDGTVPSWSAARNASLNSLQGSLVSFSEHATIFDDRWVVGELRRELLSITPINRQPIDGSGHPVFSAIIDGIQRAWTIRSIEFRPNQPYLIAPDKIEAVATISFERGVPGLRRGSVVPKVIAQQGDLVKQLPIVEVTSANDIAQRQLVYKLEAPSTEFDDGAIELTLTIPGARADAKAAARLVLKNPELKGKSSLDKHQILMDALGKVVHLRVAGQQAPGETFTPPIHGTGVVIRTTSNDPEKRFRILTAGHVVKADSAWARVGMGRDRDIYITTLGGPGNFEQRAWRGVSVNTQDDIAQVVATPLTQYSAELRSTPLVKDQEYVVVSWGLDAQQDIPDLATAQIVKILGPDPSDARLVRLQASLVPSESGSPVLDKDGAVVAIVLMREVIGGQSSVALALPISQVLGWVDQVKQNPVIEPRPQPLDSFLIDVLKWDVDAGDKPSFCVFLGKSSALNQTDAKPEDAPFGKELLRAIKESPSSEALRKRPLRVTREAQSVNLRTHCPEVQNKKAYYGSVVSVLDSSRTINVRQVIPMRYLDDDFYWGIISRFCDTSTAGLCGG